MEREEQGRKWDRWKVSPVLRRRMGQAARDLRRQATPSERILWEALRDRRLDGWKFRRQAAFGPFVVDFYCPSARLVIEIDGSVHQGREEVDAHRQALLSDLGLNFLRFSASAIESDIPSVLTEIRHQLSLKPPS